MESTGRTQQPRDGEQDGLRAALPAAAMACVALILLAWLQLRPRDGATQVAALYAVGMSAPQVLAAAVSAGARPLRVGGLANLIVVDLGERGSIERLYESGAWLVLDPVAAGSCLTARQPRFAGVRA